MIWDTLSATGKPIFALAPMNDVTDSVFRQIVARCSAPDLFFTEFVSVDSLASPGKVAMENKLFFTPGEQPLIVQVWGLEPKNYESQCAELAQAGYDGIDINMGCPVAKIIVKGACSALMNDRGKAKLIIDSAKAGARDIPVSVKTRIGYDKIDLTWIEFLLQQDLPALIVHCRTVQEMSNVPNHTEVLPEIIEMRNAISPTTKIIANGDITTQLQGEQLANKYGLDGVMIGRGVFEDPFVFAEQSPWTNMTPLEKLALFEEHIELFDKTWGKSKNPDVLKKFAKIYLVGFKGAHKIREQIMNQRSIDGVRDYLNLVTSSEGK